MTRGLDSVDREGGGRDHTTEPDPWQISPLGTIRGDPTPNADGRTRDALHSVVSAVRAGRDAWRTRLSQHPTDDGMPLVDASRRAYVDGWSDALVAVQLAAVDASAALAD